MATRNEKATNYKQIAYLLGLALVGTIAWRGYLWGMNKYEEKDIVSIQNKITTEEKRLITFSDQKGFDKLQYVQSLENSTASMPWSEHIETIIEYLKDLIDVDKSDTFNVSFSDFELSLEKISLHGYVSNLRLLYQGSRYQTGSKSLIEKFESLDFLKDLSIKEYEKSSDERGYEFVLNANVTNENGK